MEYGAQRSSDIASTLCMGCMAPKTGAAFCSRCGWNQAASAHSVLHLPPGTVLRDSYIVGRVLGQGGFGITYLGWDIQLQRKVAIKEYFPQSIASRQPGSVTVTPTTSNLQADFDYGLRSFMSEGQILARFSDHPCIVSVLSLFEENRTGYMVMGYLDGTTLSQSLAAAGGRLPYDTVREIMMRVMDGLREVHSQGLLHRDISPDNVYLTRQGPVKILDFGAARMAVGERSQSLSVVLKEGYAPEEQYRRSGNQGPWTDVYAVAATFYRCLTGVTPPPSLDRLHSDTLRSPRELGIPMPPDAEAALLRALSVMPGMRYQSVETFQAALGAGVSYAASPVTPPVTLPADPVPPAAEPPQFALYDPTSVALATLMGSPLAGGTVMAINYSRIGRGGGAKAVFAGIGLTALGILVGRFLPTVASTPIAIGLCFAMKGIAQAQQGKTFDEHIRSGGRSGSRWAATGIGLIFLVAIVGVIVAGYAGYTAVSRGPKVVIGTRDEVYYRGSATRDDAESLGSELRSIGYFSDKGFAAILSKDTEGTAVSFVVKPGIWDRSDMVFDFEDIGRQIAPSVGGFPLHVRLVDSDRDTKKDLAVGKMDFGSKDTIYFYGSASQSEANSLAEALKTEGYFGPYEATVMLARNDSAPILAFVVKDGFWEDPSHVEGFKDLVRKVAGSVGGLPVEMHLVNSRVELKINETVH